MRGAVVLNSQGLGYLQDIGIPRRGGDWQMEARSRGPWASVLVVVIGEGCLGLPVPMWTSYLGSCCLYDSRAGREYYRETMCVCGFFTGWPRLSLRLLGNSGISRRSTCS